MAMPAPEAAPTTPCTESKGFIYSWQHTAAHTDSQPHRCQMSSLSTNHVQKVSPHRGQCCKPMHQSCRDGKPPQMPVLRRAYLPRTDIESRMSRNRSPPLYLLSVLLSAHGPASEGCTGQAASQINISIYV